MLVLVLSLLLQAPMSADDSLRAALLAAEDARARTPAQLDQLTGALGARDTLIQRIAARALGRLERPELIVHLARALDAGAVSVRIEAANAVAQAATRGDAAPALGALTAALASDRAPEVRGALLAAMGRLPLTPDQVSTVDAHLRRELAAADGSLSGALRGSWDLLRRPGRGAMASPALIEALGGWAVRAGAAADRRLALHALVVIARADSALLARALDDRDDQVRRIATLGLGALGGPPAREPLLRRALRDSAAMVRIEAIRAWGGPGVRETLGCEPLIAAVSTDSSRHVQLLAIDLLGAGCRPLGPPTELLDAVAREPLTATAWHRPARALLALAAADSARASIRIGRFAASEFWWARAAAARAAGRLGDRRLLTRLLDDAEDNVREAALAALVGCRECAADSAALRQLGRGDYQLVLTAARTLADSDLGVVVAREALRVLRRITAEGKETSRDTRLALLALIEKYGTADEGRALEEDARDFDPVVADRAARIAAGLTGRPVVADPRPLPPAQLPAPSALRTMRQAVIVMEDGGRMVLRLRPDEAPTTVARFVAMARAGWFNGLTLHRVVPNFVVQGGSPGANEYVGGGAFTRDEVGGGHWRGTIGISTRGRDTGDGQIFFNLVDNLRLDHDYTVIGEVIAGLDVMDRIQEGAVIARIELPVP